MAITSDYSLTDSQKAHFLTHGFVKLSNCFTHSQAASFTKDMWTRLGMSPTDPSSWTNERIHMPSHVSVPVSEIAPKAWAAICELLGGEERISDGAKGWSDAFIVNLGKEEYDAEVEVDWRDLDGWHNDGDFFVHFLDSPEQALLVIPLWSDVVPKGGGTVVSTDGMKAIARHLYDNPDSVTPWMKALDDPEAGTYEGVDFWLQLAKNPSETSDEGFFEVTGEVGDVFLLHPFMLHSASKNLLRRPRIITNPPVQLKEPFCFDREDKTQYSLVELKTLMDLGKPDGLRGWKITGRRAEWTPRRIKRMEEMKQKELERLQR